MPHKPAKMNSGESAVPATTSVRRRPLTRAVRVSPGTRPCAWAKPSETRASIRADERVPPSASRARPLATVTRFRRGGTRGSRPIRHAPQAGEDELWGERRAGDHERPAAAVDQGRQGVAGDEAVRLGEAFG